MGKYNADEQSLFEPIEIVLEGKEYKIEKITTLMIEAATGSGQSDAKDINVLCKQLAIFIGGEASEYSNIDVRKISRVLKYITDEVMSAIDGAKPKN